MVVFNSDGYLFKFLGSIIRFLIRWKFLYFVCICFCGLDEYFCLYCYGYKYFFVFINKIFFFFLFFWNWYRNGCFFYVVDFSYWGVLGKIYVGYFLGVGCLFNFCIYFVFYLFGCIVFLKVFCWIGFYFNLCWIDWYINN